MRGLGQLLTARHYAPIALALLFVGLGDAVAGPYFALFATDKAHLGPLALGGLLTLRAASSIAIAFAFGRWFDRAPAVTPLFLALAGAIVGYALLAFTTNYVALLAIVAIPLATAASGFPQLFALAKGHLDKSDFDLAERGVSLLRALWSVAWATGPAIGAMLVVPYDFRGVFLATALCGGAAIVIVLSRRVRAPERTASTGAEPRSRMQSIRAAGCAAAALTLFHMAMFMGSIALSISVTHGMGGTKQDVGHAFSLCAFLEVLVMMVFVARPVNAGSRVWMSAGFVAFAVYFAAIAIAPSVEVVLAAQAIRALAIGIVGCLGIGYAQSVTQGRVGAAAALFANSVNAGSLLSGLATGAWAQAFGYESMFGACAALSGLGLLILQFQPRTPSTGSSHGT